MNFENPLRIDKDIVMSLVNYFSGDTVLYAYVRDHDFELSMCNYNLHKYFFVIRVF